MSRQRIFEAADCQEAIEKILHLQRSGDCILVKGSRGVQLDRLAAALQSPDNSPQSNGQGG
jgi:UDP-N-acetylmuramoyl-tripeptide--D-alanyl-D-alanine ligase